MEFAAEKLDEIRIAVTEGFYAVPRGGIEIGGVLFGRRNGVAIQVEAYRMIECEHRTGPSFLLSDKDRTGLAALLAVGPGEPVGWFHSHTRSEIFLSADDIALHHAFFPQPWQFALVMRPGNMKPLRAGYFFPGTGKVEAANPCHEFVIEPSVRPEKRRVYQPAEKIAVKALEPTAARAVVEEPKPQPEPLPVPPPIAAPALPAFLNEPERKSGSGWVWVAALFAVAALSSAAFFTRDSWMPVSQAARPAPPALRLQASDAEGRLLLRWNAAAVADAAGGELAIEDGEKHLVVPLDAAQVTGGFYLYPRESEKTAVRMKAGSTEESVTFSAPLPHHEPTPEEIEKAGQDARMKVDLQNQTLRNKLLQKRVKDLSKKLEQQKP